MEEFLKEIKNLVNEFNKINGIIRIISHLDSDGLASSSIMVKALKRRGVKFCLSTVRQIDHIVLSELSREEYDNIMFLDLGSGSLKDIDDKLGNKKIFILDHHKPEDYKTRNIFLLNPHTYGIDGSKDISCSGIVYLFAKALDARNMDLAHIALIGAIGDTQEDNGFYSELNNFILDDAVNSDKIEVKVGLKMFGMQTRPMNKVLEYSTNPYIPGVSGNELGCKKFLDELNLNVKLDNGGYKKLVQLTHDELKTLVTGIIIRRLGSEENPDDVLGKIYLVKDEEDESPTKDAKEFSTLLNATGRMDRPSLGICCCLGDKESKAEAFALLLSYKKEIINSLNWFYHNKDKIIEEDHYVIINAEANIRDTMIGTLGSIISKSNIYKPGTVILTMAYTMDGNIKISIRIAGRLLNIDLRHIIKEIVDKIGGIGGGHKYAAGALISQEKEKDFINVAKGVLSNIVLETNSNIY